MVDYKSPEGSSEGRVLREGSALEPTQIGAPFGQGRDITVILAHFDCADLLVRAIESIRDQSHRNWVCVVVDDHSPSPEPVRRLRALFPDDRLVWLRTSLNVGQFRIYNKLLPVIASPHIALQDADDSSVPARFERLLEEIEARECDLVGSAVRRISDNGETLHSVSPPVDVNKALWWRFRRAIFTGPTMLGRTAFLREADGYDGTTRFAGDSEFVYRAIFLGRVRNHPEPLYNYNVRRGSLTQSPETGFGSPARTKYARALRSRFYRHLLLSKAGRLRPARLKGKPNDIDFDLLTLD